MRSLSKLTRSSPPSLTSTLVFLASSLWGHSLLQWSPTSGICVTQIHGRIEATKALGYQVRFGFCNVHMNGSNDLSALVAVKPVFAAQNASKFRCGQKKDVRPQYFILEGWGESIVFTRVNTVGRWQTFGTVCVFEVILWGVFIRSWFCAKVLFFTLKGYSCSSGKWLGLQEVGSQHLVFEVHVQNQFKSPWLKQRQFAEAQSFAFAEDHGSGTWHLNDGCRRFEAALIGNNALTFEWCMDGNGCSNVTLLNFVKLFSLLYSDWISLWCMRSAVRRLWISWIQPASFCSLMAPSPCRLWCIQAFWNVLSTRRIQAAAFGGSNTTPLIPLNTSCNASSLSCGQIQIRNQALLSKSGVAPQKVLFVDDAAKNIQSVRCAFFSGHGDDSSPKQWIEGASPPYAHQSSFAKCFNFSDLFANSSTVVFKKKKTGRKEDLWNSQAVFVFFCRPLGICAVHLPDGLSDGAWNLALNMYKAHQKDTNWGAPSPLCEGRLSVVGCQKSLAWHPAVFSGPFFSRPVGGQRRIDGESSICVRSNIPRINLYWIFHFRTLDCPSELGPKKSAIRRPVALCDCCDPWRCVNLPRHRPSWPQIRILIFWKLWWRSWQHGNFEDFYSVHGYMIFEFGKMCQETDIRIAEVKRDAYEFRPGIETTKLVEDQ